MGKTIIDKDREKVAKSKPLQIAEFVAEYKGVLALGVGALGYAMSYARGELSLQALVGPALLSGALYAVFALAPCLIEGGIQGCIFEAAKDAAKKTVRSVPVVTSTVPEGALHLACKKDDEGNYINEGVAEQCEKLAKSSAAAKSATAEVAELVARFIDWL